jgi:Tfp pilus assembly protein PilP
MINQTAKTHQIPKTSKAIQIAVLWAGMLCLSIAMLFGDATPAIAQSKPDSTSKNQKYVFRRQEIFEYSSRGRRDPFKPLVTEGTEEVETNLLNVEEATLTGIVWGGDQMVALFKDKKGKSHYMKKGDAVYNGRILEINDNSVIISIFQFGTTRRLELRVTEHVSDASGG